MATGTKLYDAVPWARCTTQHCPMRRSWLRRFLAATRIFCWEAWNDEEQRVGMWWRLFWVIGFAAHRIDKEHRQPLFSERYGFGTFLCWRGRWLIRPLRSGWRPK